MKIIFLCSVFIASALAAIGFPPEYNNTISTNDETFLNAINKFVPDITKNLDKALNGENYTLVLKEVAEKTNTNENKNYAAIYQAVLPQYPKINALCLAKVDIEGPKFLKETTYKLNCTIENEQHI